MKFKQFTLLMFAATLAGCLPKSEMSILSPEKRVSFDLLERNDSLFYSVKSGNTTVIEPSPLVLMMDSMKLGVNIGSIRSVAVDRHFESIFMNTGVHDYMTGNYLENRFLVRQKDGREFSIEARAYDSGVAFRYMGESATQVKVTDITSFVLPEGKELWGQDNFKHYEGAYRKYSTGTLKPDMNFGPPVTIAYNDTLYATITEGGVVDYAGMHLQVKSGKELVSVLDGTPKMIGEFATPWRVVMVGNLNTLVNNDIVYSVSKAEAKVFENNKKWIQPGRCVWSWLANYPVTFENMKKFTDWGAELGFEYNLVDEGWSYWNDNGKSDWELVKELVDYGKTKGVKTLLWKAYPDRKGIDGVQTEERVRAFFSKCKEAGVSGVKIDFFDSESQEVMEYMARTLEIAAEYELVVNYHGCSKPTGLNRTCPNELTREGVMGLEYGRSWSDQNTVTPFTRFLAGHGDYTPLTFDRGYMGETTTAHQLATAIVFTSPLMCYGGNPEDFIQSPVRSFIESLRTTWDETVVLAPSKVGEVVAFARRSGDEWFVGVLGKEAQTFKLSLSFLGEQRYNATLISDVAQQQYEVTQGMMLVSKSDVLDVSLNKAGGFVARFVIQK